MIIPSTHQFPLHLWVLIAALPRGSRSRGTACEFALLDITKVHIDYVPLHSSETVKVVGDERCSEPDELSAEAGATGGGAGLCLH